MRQTILTSPRRLLGDEATSSPYVLAFRASFLRASRSGTASAVASPATSIEQIIGSKGNDTLVGDGRPNYIDGRGGNDTIYGGGGNDTLVGGLGQDKLYGQDGNDFLDAKDGITDLVLDGGAGTDTARKDTSDPRTSVEVLFNS